MKQSIHPPQPANTKTFKLSDFCTDEEAFHIARVNIPTGKTYPIIRITIMLNCCG